MMDINSVLIEKQEDLSTCLTGLSKLSNRPVLGLDTETRAFDRIRGKIDVLRDKVVMLQLALPDVCYVIDTRRVNIEPLRQILEDRKITKVAHNVKFDYSVMKQNFGIELRGVFDTMIAERLLTCGIGSKFISLSNVCKNYLGFGLNKGVRDSFFLLNEYDDLTDDQIRYGALDALVLQPLYDAMASTLESEGLGNVAQLEFDFAECVADMELKGCLLDVDMWKSIATRMESSCRDREQQAQAFFRDVAEQPVFFDDMPVINLASPKQLLKALKKLNIMVTNVDGSTELIYDTNDKTLSKSNHPAILKLREYRKFKKLVDSYGLSILEKIHPVTGRLHPKFNQLGADTGRQSSEDPNIQQIPSDSEFRDCFISPNGYKLIAADYSQCELRILAALSGDEVMLEAFNSGKDLHTMTLSMITGDPYDALKSKLEVGDDVLKKKRGIAKAVNFLIVYGGGAHTLSLNTGISVDEAQDVINKYLQGYQGAARWLTLAGDFAKNNGYSLTRSGRKRYYNRPNPNTASDNEYRRVLGEIERQGKNSPIQGGNADVTKLACVYLKESLRDYDAQALFTVHDELVVEAREDLSEELSGVVSNCMVKAFTHYYPEVPMKCDANIGDRWIH